MTIKDRLHQLVDELPEGEIAAAAEELLLELRDHGGDSLARKLLSAPIDDEPVTDDDLAEIEAARAEAHHGEGRPWEEVRRKLAGSG